MPKTFAGSGFGQIDRLDDVGADIALQVAAADRIDQDRVLVAEAAHLEPGREDGVPTLVIGARGQLGHVVDRAVGLDPAQLSEIIDGMAAIAGAAADADQEQAALAFPQPVELGRQRLDRREWNVVANLCGRGEEAFNMGHARRPDCGGTR